MEATLMGVLFAALAVIGALGFLAFLRYRRYFTTVNTALSAGKVGSLYDYPDNVFRRLDNVVARAYLAKQPAQLAAKAVVAEFESLSSLAAPKDPVP